MYEAHAPGALTAAPTGPVDEWADVEWDGVQGGGWDDAGDVEDGWDAGDDAALDELLAEAFGDGGMGGEGFGADLGARLRHTIADPGGAGVAGWLRGLDPARLDAYHRVLLARAWESQRRHTEARYQQVVAACLEPDPDRDTDSDTDPDPDGGDVCGPAAQADASRDGSDPEDADLAGYARAEELRLALGLSPGQVCYQGSHARALTGAYRAAWAELAAGRASTAQVRELLAQTRVVPAEVLPAVLARVLPHAPDQTTSAFRATVRRAVAALVPEQAAAEFAEAHAERSVALRDDETEVVDATGRRVIRASEVTATTDPLQARRISQLIEGEARRLRAVARHDANTALDDARAAHAATRSADPDARAATAAALAQARQARAEVYAIRIGAWRVDALEHLLELGTLAARDGKNLTAHGREVQLVVVVGIDTLLGLSQDPAELRGYGALPAPVLGELTAAATGWLLALTDRAGRPLGTERYRPTPAIQDWITATRPTCTAPGCTTPVEWCQRDHTEPYDHADPAAGGRTDTANIAPRCPGHHELKTHAGFHVELDPDGSLITTTPAGHTYRTPPPEMLPTAGLSPPDEPDPPDPPDPPEPPDAPDPPDVPPGQGAEPDQQPGHDPPPF